MPRVARLDTPGLLHHVMIRGIERRRIFNDNEDRENLIGRLSILLPETKPNVMPGRSCQVTPILFRSGPSGIANLMKRLLTGYAVYYSQRRRLQT